MSALEKLVLSCQWKCAGAALDGDHTPAPESRALVPLEPPELELLDEPPLEPLPEDDPPDPLLEPLVEDPLDASLIELPLLPEPPLEAAPERLPESLPALPPELLPELLPEVSPPEPEQAMDAQARSAVVRRQPTSPLSAIADVPQGHLLQSASGVSIGSMRRFTRAVSMGAALLVAACSRVDKGPVLASSAGQPTYALSYVDELNANVKSVGDAQDQERKLAANFPTRVDELKKPDWDLVRAVVDRSDAAGKSADFFDAHGEVDAVRTFWIDEKPTVDGKVAGGAQYVVKQATCASTCTTLDVGGPAVFALNESMEKEIVKRLHGSNDAFLLIEREHTALGPQNTAALEKLADDVAQATYLVHVDIVVHRERLKRMISDASDVKKTLEHLVQEEQAYRAQPGRTDADKKASDDRVTQAVKTSGEIDGAIAQAQAAVNGSDQAIAQATKDYDDALKNLRDKIDQKKSGRT